MDLVRLRFVADYSDIIHFYINSRLGSRRPKHCTSPHASWQKFKGAKKEGKEEWDWKWLESNQQATDSPDASRVKNAHPPRLMCIAQDLPLRYERNLLCALPLIHSQFGYCFCSFWLIFGYKIDSVIVHPVHSVPA